MYSVLCAHSTVGAWRSLVAHLHGVQGVGGSNPLAPTQFRTSLQMWYHLGSTEPPPPPPLAIHGARRSLRHHLWTRSPFPTHRWQFLLALFGGSRSDDCSIFVTNAVGNNQRPTSTETLVQGASLFISQKTQYPFVRIGPATGTHHRKAARLSSPGYVQLLPRKTASPIFLIVATPYCIMIHDD